MSDANILVTIATYNEIENLPRLVEAIFEHAPQVDLLVIDDNSPDGTGDWCDERAAQDRRVHCVHRTGKLGLGTAIVAGMQYAIEHGYDFVLNMDADFSHHPRYIPAILSGMEQADGGSHIDVMIGSRYIAGGGVEGWPLKRQLMSTCINMYTRTLLGLKARDCSGAYRCYRVSRLKQLDFGQLRARGYAFQQEMLWQLKRIGCRFAETPIVFADRAYGQSKINSKEAVAALWHIAALGWRNWVG